MNFDPSQLAKIIYQSPERTGQTLKNISKKMGGITAKYLSRQINPDDNTAKIGIEDFVYLTAVTDFTALDYIEAAFGRTAFVIPQLSPTNPGPIMKAVSKISKEFGENVQEIAKSLEDGVLDKEEIKRCRKENQDLIKACVEMDAYLAALDEN